ncbi:hypothetical protein [Rhodococcus marinonascens]|uniref:hypothetical protein n=1 Tax=Rhodococcus marinonascens TaxID=38311 RepID=UPI000A990AE4|nr:hypothetical protein [Rhodococcus marinonascens]
MTWRWWWHRTREGSWPAALATSLLLASAAGGPATIAAVGAGILVSYGVGELIEYVAD